MARNLLRIYCANLVFFLKKIIFSEEFRDRNRKNPKDFSRKRILPFHDMMFFLMNINKGSLQDELDYFFKAILCADVAERKVTKGAFSKARLKLPHRAFIELNGHLVHFFYDHFPVRKWHDLRLLAIDGSTVKVPKVDEIKEHFGAWNVANGETCPMARISHLFDVLNKITVDAVIGPKERGERSLASLHLQHVGQNDLVLMDRGYPAFWLFSQILSMKADFCARVAITRWKETWEFYNSGAKEAIVTIQPGEAAMAECVQRGIPPSPMQVRMIRVELDNGETEILMTSLLDCEKYPHNVFKELYHFRWNQEENYKLVKCRIELENFSGKSVESVYQDFHAKFFSLNLAAAIMHPVQDVLDSLGCKKKHPHQCNRTQALSKMKDCLFLLFKRCNPLEILDALLQVLLKTTEAVRPGRKFPRNHSASKRVFHPCYKPTR